MREQGAADHAQQQGRRHHRQEVHAEGLKDGLAIVGLSSDLHRRAVGQARRGDVTSLSWSLGILSQTSVPGRRRGAGRWGRTAPVLRYIEQNAFPEGLATLTKKPLALSVPAALNELLQRADAAALVYRGTGPQPGLDHLVVLAFERAPSRK